MLNLNELIGFGVGGSQPKVTFIDTTVFYDGGFHATKTFTGVNIGTPSPDRIVVVGVNGTGPTAAVFSGAKLGGSGGTPMTQIAQLAGGQAGVALFYLPFPDGATTDIYFTCSTSAGSFGVTVHTITGANQQAPYVHSTDTADVLTLSANVESGTAGLAHVAGTAISATPTCTWAGLTLNETLNTYTNEVVSSATGAFTASASPLTITADWANVTTSAAGIFAAWR
jgi:hypothetical protein